MESWMGIGLVVVCFLLFVGGVVAANYRDCGTYDSTCGLAASTTSTSSVTSTTSTVTSVSTSTIDCAETAKGCYLPNGCYAHNNQSYYAYSNVICPQPVTASQNITSISPITISCPPFANQIVTQLRDNGIKVECYDFPQDNNITNSTKGD